jgi:hypothetical protein
VSDITVFEMNFRKYHWSRSSLFKNHDIFRQSES